MALRVLAAKSEARDWRQTGPPCCWAAVPCPPPVCATRAASALPPRQAGRARLRRASRRVARSAANLRGLSSLETPLSLFYFYHKHSTRGESNFTNHACGAVFAAGSHPAGGPPRIVPPCLASKGASARRKISCAAGVDLAFAWICSALLCASAVGTGRVRTSVRRVQKKIT